jgi:Yip1 domain
MILMDLLIVCKSPGEKTMNSHLHSEKVYETGPARTPLYLLPGFYAKTIFRPSARTFARESEYARWNLVWLQLVILVAIPIILGLIRSIFRDRSAGVNTNANVIFGLLDAITVGATIGAAILKVILLPILFFVEVSLQYGLARVFGGRGRYIDHGFSMLLYQVPLTLIGSIIIAVFVILHFFSLFFAPIISLVFFVYGVYLNIFAVMGVHTINRGKAVATVVIPYVIGGLAMCGGLAIVAQYLARAISSLH